MTLSQTRHPRRDHVIVWRRNKMRRRCHHI